MPFWPNFIGGFYQTRSPYAGIDQAVNIYTETRLVPGSLVEHWIYGTPGLKLETTVTPANGNGCRGWFTQDGRTWVTVGNTLYERTATATYTSRGLIADDGFPVSYASNGAGGQQLAIVGGGNVYVLDLLTDTLTTATLPFLDPVMIVFQDGYGLVNQADTPTVWFSALEDFTTWDALDFFARSNSSDNCIGLAVTRDRVWFLGSKTTTQYYDTGDADNPWQPYPGTTIQVGAVTAWAITMYNDVMRFLSMSAKGEVHIVQVKVDASVQILSTPPIVDALISCTTLDDAEMMVYEQDNHPFIVLTLPSCPDDIKTYHCDLLEQNLWAARAGWDEDTGVYTRWRARGTTAFATEVFVGDYATGDLYTLDLNTFTDNDVTLRRERIAPFLSTQNQWLFLRQVQLQAQQGVGLETGDDEDVDPEVELQISRDAAQTWVSAGGAALGAMGNLAARTIWRNLGRMRADLAAIRVIQTAAVRCAWGGLWLTTENGTGQL